MDCEQLKKKQLIMNDYFKRQQIVRKTFLKYVEKFKEIEGLSQDKESQLEEVNDLEKEMNLEKDMSLENLTDEDYDRILKEIQRSNSYDATKEKSPYIKTMIFYLIQFKNRLKPEDWYGVAAFYGIDGQYIDDIILHGKEEYDYVIYDDAVVELSDKEQYYLFVSDLIHYYFIYKNLLEIKKDNSKETCTKNLSIYQNMIGEFTQLNADIATRECMKRQYFSEALIPQCDTVKNIQAIQKILRLAQSNQEWCEKDLMGALYRCYNNDIKVHADVLYLILNLQMIAECPLIKEQVRKASTELTEILLQLLHNAKIIAIYKNYNKLNQELPWQERGSKDQTTRLQILYEYNNGDQYSLRFDFPHIDVRHFHLNNSSKGGVDYFPLNESQYLEIIKENADYAEWFIHYGNGLYFLREKYRNEIEQEVHKQLYSKLIANMHYVICENSSEVELLELFHYIIGNMVGVGVMSPIDKINPERIYRERLLFSLVEEYFYRQSDATKEEIDKQKDVILEYLARCNLIDTKDTWKLLKECEIIDILSFAIDGIEERRTVETVLK